MFFNPVDPVTPVILISLPVYPTCKTQSWALYSWYFRLKSTSVNTGTCHALTARDWPYFSRGKAYKGEGNIAENPLFLTLFTIFSIDLYGNVTVYIFKGCYLKMCFTHTLNKRSPPQFQQHAPNFPVSFISAVSSEAYYTRSLMAWFMIFVFLKSCFSLNFF